jgi:hypothetical protein
VCLCFFNLWYWWEKRNIVGVDLVELGGIRNVISFPRTKLCVLCPSTPGSLTTMTREYRMSASNFRKNTQLYSSK